MWKYWIIGALLLQGSNEQPAKQKAQPQEHRSAARVPPALSDQAQVETGNNPDRALEGQRATQGEETKAFQRTQIRQYWVLVGTSIVTVILLIAYTVFAGLQWWQIKKQAALASEQVGKMQAQLEAINKQEEHLSAQAIAARDAADMAQGQLVAMQHQEQAQIAALEEQRRMVEQNERAVKAAEDSVRIAEETFYIGNAPYFGVMGAIIDGIQEGCSPRVTIGFINGGKTPAWHFNGLACLVLGESPKSPEHWFINPAVEDMGDTFYPAGEQKTIEYTRTGLKFTFDQILALKTEVKFLYLVVTVSYKDIRNKLGTPRTFICGYDWKTKKFGDYQIT